MPASVQLRPSSSQLVQIKNFQKPVLFFMIDRTIVHSRTAHLCAFSLPPVCSSFLFLVVFHYCNNYVNVMVTSLCTMSPSFSHVRTAKGNGYSRSDSSLATSHITHKQVEKPKAQTRNFIFKNQMRMVVAGFERKRKRATVE